MTTSSGEFRERLTARLRKPLPGRRAQAAFAPELSYGRHAGPPRSAAKSAAVLALLYPDRDEWRIPMTLRPNHLPDHAGQICLPGGMTEPDETNEQAAIRELDEELGVAADRFRVLGQLSPLYVFGTDFWVTPFVGICESRLEFTPSPDEVAEVVDMPVEALLDFKNYGGHRIRRRGISFHAPHIAFGRHRIWGATCMMLGELIAILNDVRAPTILA